MTAERGVDSASRAADQTQLTDEQIEEYLSLLEMGAPPLLACQRLGIRFDLVESTLVADATFVERVEQVKRLLADNVVAAMYKKALGGSVYAQLHYLRQCRPKPLDLSNNLEGMPLDELDELFYQVTKSKYSDRWDQERTAASAPVDDPATNDGDEANREPSDATVREEWPASNDESPLVRDA